MFAIVKVVKMGYLRLEQGYLSAGQDPYDQLHLVHLNRVRQRHANQNARRFVPFTIIHPKVQGGLANVESSVDISPDAGTGTLKDLLSHEHKTMPPAMSPRRRTCTYRMKGQALLPTRKRSSTSAKVQLASDVRQMKILPDYDRLGPAPSTKV